MNNTPLSIDVLNILNDALEKDPVAMMALISTTVPTNAKIAESYDNIELLNLGISQHQ